MKKIVLILISVITLLISCNQNGPVNERSSKKTTNSTESTELTAGLTNQGLFYSVEGTAEGIKITLKEGLNIRDNSGSVFKVFDSSGKELPLNIAIDNSERNTRTEYIYRFVEPYKEYVIEWFVIFVDNKGKEKEFWDKTKCMTIGGLDLSDYLNVSTVENAKMSINYDKDKSVFVLKLLSDAQSLSDFAKDDSIFSEISFMFRTLLGEPYWTHTEYVDDKWLEIKRLNTTDSEINITNAKNGYHVYKSFPDYQKREYDYKYCGHLIKKFYYNDGSYTRTIYETSSWTEQMKFN